MSRLDDLIAAHLEGEIDDLGIKELEEFLRTDDSASVRFATMLRHDLLLGELLADKALTVDSNRRRAQPSNQSRPLWMSSPLTWASIAALLAISAGFALSYFTSDTFVTVASIRGGINVDFEGATRAVRLGDPIASGSHLSVAPGAHVQLDFADGTVIELDENTSVTMSETSGAKRVQIDGGILSASIAKQPPDRPMTFATPHAQAIVRGTRLKLALSGLQTRLEVTEGLVDLVRQDERVPIHAGEFAVAQPGIRIAAAPLSVFALNFEDGTRPPALRDGKVVTGPPRADDGFCVAGLEKREDIRTKKEVWFEEDNVEMFTYAQGMRLSFDCWFTSATTGVVEGCFYVENKRQTVAFQAERIPQGRWTRVDMPLDDFRYYSDPGLGLEQGDGIKNIIISAWGNPDDVLYIDNITIINP
jgi:hypothetical protein